MYDHEYPFDPTYGYDLAKLLAVTPPEPVADFESFWRQTRQETLAQPTELELVEHRPLCNDQRTVCKATFNSFEGFRCGAWVTIPNGQAPQRVEIKSHGYGGRHEPAEQSFEPAIVFAPVGRGFGLSARPQLPDASPGHVLHGIESRETYLHRGCVADIWAAVGAVLEQWPAFEGKIDFIGGSFGGGIGAMAMAWEDRVRRAYLEAPSFGHHPLRVTMPCVGSGRHVTARVAREPDLLTRVLPYYDAAVAARFIRFPVLVGAALFDPAVPPPGQFAVHNAIPSPHGALHVLDASHFTPPTALDQARRTRRRLEQWFIQGQ